MHVLHSGRAVSQQAIVDALRSLGHDVTQATVSRDLRAVGAVKVPDTNGAVYRLPDDVVRSGTDLVQRELQRNLDTFALSILPAGSLVVIHTAPGHANLLARAIDLTGLDEVVGTVAGDDTILVATPDGETASLTASVWLNGRNAEVTG
jgi:transcriptional regulator of arginine metabolism